MTLKDAIAKSGTVKGTRCSVAVMRDTLTPAQRAEFDEAAALTTEELPHTVLSRAIASEWDATIKANTLQRHRAHECNCDHDAR